MRILLATGLTDLDESLREIFQKNEIETIGECYSAEVLVRVAQELSADTVIITILLAEDSLDTLVNAITTLKKTGIRVIILPGDIDHEETRRLVIEVVPYGVYDFVFDDVSPEKVLHRLQKPAVLGDVPEFLAEAAMSQQKLSQEIANHAEMVVAAEDQREDKPKGKFNILNTIITRNDRVEVKNKQGWLNKFTKINQTEENVSKNIHSDKPVIEIQKKRYSKTPSVILGLGNQNLNDWFDKTFSHLVEVISPPTDVASFRQEIQNKQPEIAVIMRSGPTGGVPYADELAIFASQYVRHVIFIAGELDDEGMVMAEAVKKVRGKVLSCPPGETISGEELVLLIQNTINETITEAEPEKDYDFTEEKTRGAGESFFQGISQVTEGFKKAIHRPEKEGKIGKLITEEPPINIARLPKHPSAITAGGVLLIVSPWRPGLAGRIAAQAARIFSDGGSDVAVISASGRSTTALWLGITDEELIMSDWRVPGSQVPIEREVMKIWAVDPAKSLHMDIKEDLDYVVKVARNKATYTVIDFGEDVDLAHSYIHQKDAVLLFLVPSSDPVECKTSLFWLKRTLGQKDNIVIGFDLREQGEIPRGITSKLTITTTPEEALQNALKKSLDQFIWTEVIN